MSDFENTLLDMGPMSTPSIIKVIGVGGGGGNAVNHMYRNGITGVNFLVCNTDNKALAASPVPAKLLLGNGLGAGNDPNVGREKAEESLDRIHAELDKHTHMVFITAGMGGGTGTGAAPVIAREAKKKGILTVGIVTIPFLWEGIKKIDQALDGVEEMSRNVDALLVINNERLLTICANKSVTEGWRKADETLCTAARSIVEIINMNGRVVVDFNDVKNTLKDGGVAIMSTGYGEGEDRVRIAIEDALNSPLLNDNNVFDSKKVMLVFSYSDREDGEEFMMDEMNEVTAFMGRFRHEIWNKWGLYTDPSLGKKVRVTILASGFGLHHAPEKNTEEEPDELPDTKISRIRNIYPGFGDDVKIRKRRNVFIYPTDDLDNEDLIFNVDEKATAMRSREELEKIKRQSAGVPPTKQETVDESQIISFNI